MKNDGYFQVVEFEVIFFPPLCVFFLLTCLFFSNGEYVYKSSGFSLSYKKSNNNTAFSVALDLAQEKSPAYLLCPKIEPNKYQ